MAEKPAGIPEEIKHYINGEYVDSTSGETFDILEPTTNENFLTAPLGGQNEADAAIAAAKAAFDEGSWANMLPRARWRILNAIADEVEKMNDELAEIESFDSGLPIRQARGQANRAAENFRFFADLIVANEDKAFSMPGRQINYVNRKPHGVAVLITPWNTPFMQESWKLAPALASGATVVLKPAEFTPVSASLWPGIMERAGLPKGVFNIVYGDGMTGDKLVTHPDAPLVSFTGSLATGKKIFERSAPYMKHLSLELGGKSPAIIFEDADFEKALDSTLFGVFSLNGERCTASSRLLVQRSIYDKFVEAYAERAKKIVVGPPSDEKSEIAALVHPEHYEKVTSYIEIGKEEARLVAGGNRPDHLPEGNYVEATVFADVPSDARIFQEEIFGPVVAITPFDTEEEAIELANDVEYGLAAYVWTNDIARAHNVSHQIESGMVWINSHNVRDLRTPFGGVKGSGLGHEGGYRSLDFYSVQQAIHVTLGDVHTTRFGATGYADNDLGLGGPSA